MLVEKLCIHCGEIILENEEIPDDGGKMHRECLIRAVAGSVKHQQRKCSCFGGSGHDDEKLSVRENARAATQYFQDHQDKRAKAKWN